MNGLRRHKQREWEMTSSDECNFRVVIGDFSLVFRVQVHVAIGFRKYVCGPDFRIKKKIILTSTIDIGKLNILFYAF